MNRVPRSDVEHIFGSALERVDPQQAVQGVIHLNGDHVSVFDHAYPLPSSGVYVIAIGKAAVAMLRGLEYSLGASMAGGIVVTKQMPEGVPQHVKILIGGHPVPDERSLAAGRAVREFVASVPPGSLVFCLISGGGSALIEDLRVGVSLAELQRITMELLRAGANIQELNAVRSRLSTLKAGGLLRMLAHVTVVNLIVSDVLGDDVQAIASGPTVAGAEREQADSVVEGYGISADLPESQASDVFNVAPPQTDVIASVATALEAAAVAARELGYHVTVLSHSITGEARVVGGIVGAIVADSAAGLTTIERPVCILAGGEMTVTVTGDGVGGRNSEAALAAAIRLSGIEGISVGFLATDGDDGVTGAAGAIIDGTTVTIEQRADARRSLQRNDSYTFLQQSGAAFTPGMTGTNVNDLIIALIH